MARSSLINQEKQKNLLIIPRAVSCSFPFHVWSSNHELILVLNVYWGRPRQWELGHSISCSLLGSCCFFLLPSGSLKAKSIQFSKHWEDSKSQKCINEYELSIILHSSRLLKGEWIHTEGKRGANQNYYHQTLYLSSCKGHSIPRFSISYCFLYLCHKELDIAVTPTKKIELKHQRQVKWHIDEDIKTECRTKYHITICVKGSSMAHWSSTSGPSNPVHIIFHGLRLRQT